MTVKILFEPRDLWVGVYWNRIDNANGDWVRWWVYVCIVPMLPIRFYWEDKP